MKSDLPWVAGPLPSPGGTWALLVCLGLLLTLPAQADNWTNAAGHVITAKLMAIEGEQVLLQNTNGRTWRVPLASLKPADRQRAREQTGTEPLPGDLKIPFDQAQEDINRAAQFLQGGKITREEYAARCQTIQQRFEHLGLQVLKERGGLADTETMDRLKHRLAQSAQSAEAAVLPPRPPNREQ